MCRFEVNITNYSTFKAEYLKTLETNQKELKKA